MPSQSALSADEKSKVKSTLDNSSQRIFTATAARIYFGHPQPNRWSYGGLQGALAFIRDDSKGAFILRLVDLTGTRGVIWEHELYEAFEYNQDRPFFHSFAGDKCMIGFVFADEKDAKVFFKKVMNRKVDKVKTSSSEKKKTAKGGRIDRSKSMIPGPTACSFVHVAHMGYDADKGFTFTNVDPSWTAFLSELEGSGISREVIESNMDYIKGFVRDAQSAAPPAIKRPPPLLASRNRGHTQQGSVASSVNGDYAPASRAPPPPSRPTSVAPPLPPAAAPPPSGPTWAAPPPPPQSPQRGPPTAAHAPVAVSLPPSRPVSAVLSLSPAAAPPSSGPDWTPGDGQNKVLNALIQKLHEQPVSHSEVEGIIRQAIDTKLENAPLRLLNTWTGRLCTREAQINAFMESTEYKELLLMTHTPLRTEHIKEAVAKYFSWAMLSHRWQSNELLLHDIQDKGMYDLDAAETTVKLQMFCKIARDAGYRWAWSDTCCIDQKNNVELQESVNSMFVWYHHSALTIVYLSDVPPSSTSGALAKSVWNTRGWTVQEFLAPDIVLFYQVDWTLYLNDCSSNYKESAAILQELQDSTGIDAQALVAFRPDMTGAREKIRWASNRVTTLQEDVAYSLFGIFGVHLPVIYGEKKQNALGRLLQEIIAQSGDITALDWVGKPSQFNSCLPAEIASYKPPPCMSPSLPEDQTQMPVSAPLNAADALTLYAQLDKLNPPRFANRRLQLPCIVFPVTALRRRRGQDRDTCFTYDVKAVGLDDLVITTEDKLRPGPRTFGLIRPWDRHDLGLPVFADDAESLDDWSDPEPESPSEESLGGNPGEDDPVDSETSERALRLLVRLGQPFGALLLVQQQGGEYKRIASDNDIIARVQDITSIGDMMDVRTLEIL
ncbi:uncharacterized protein EDB91DRAFT_1348948 [Suillus paluster]|uniref:uncharacterized protein n=1 Tax=Suillus paluster TaxID=48578 RepID=UPI001B880BFC|nr:uncharacterized protein EDB91DRAFT_1348948 [Suillus paluster]KAG1732866.1 hypothetical protein EDB91DRAFT_1348948 [Suillus paluster]